MIVADLRIALEQAACLGERLQHCFRPRDRRNLPRRSSVAQPGCRLPGCIECQLVVLQRDRGGQHQQRYGGDQNQEGQPNPDRTQ